MCRYVYLDACACETCACILYIGENQDAVVKQRLVGVEKRRRHLPEHMGRKMPEIESHVSETDFMVHNKYVEASKPTLTIFSLLSSVYVHTHSYSHIRLVL